MKWLANALLGLLVVYRWTLSPLFRALGYNCRFSPSCSAYAAEAIRDHGPFFGTGMAVARLARCHPWCEGGIDPVVPAQMRYKGSKI